VQEQAEAMHASSARPDGTDSESDQGPAGLLPHVDNLSQAPASLWSAIATGPTSFSGNDD
jgi:hypothetical protein